MRLEQLEHRFAMDTGGMLATATNLGAVDGQTIGIEEAISTSTDVDLFVFQAKAGQSVEFDIDTPQNGPGGLGSYLRLFDAAGRQLAANNDRAAPGEQFGFDAYIPYTFDQSGTFYIGVSNWLNTGYDAVTGNAFPPWFDWYTTGNYQLVITSNKVADPIDANVRPTAVVPMANGTFSVSYTVTSQTKSDTPISIYWATGSNAANAAPIDASKALYTYQHRASQGTGTFKFVVPARFITTASANTTQLIAVANPAVNLKPGGDPTAVFATDAWLGVLSASQLQSIMGKLSRSDAEGLVGPLNEMMKKYNITTLEQRAMFLAQIGTESAGLRIWPEDPGSKGNEYFLNKYWLKGNWKGLGASVVNKAGILLKIPATANAPSSKSYDLFFSRHDSLSAASERIARVTFVRNGKHFEYQFEGAVPQKLTAYLLVVDSASGRKMLAVNNSLGNFRPQDSWEFSGRGPIQLSGRFNFQEYANYADRQDIMRDPTLVSDKTKPALGFDTAGWYFVYRKKNAADIISKSAGRSTSELVELVTRTINGGTNGLADRTSRYLRARALLLDDNF